MYLKVVFKSQSQREYTGFTVSVFLSSFVQKLSSQTRVLNLLQPNLFESWILHWIELLLISLFMCDMLLFIIHAWHVDVAICVAVCFVFSTKSGKTRQPSLRSWYRRVMHCCVAFSIVPTRPCFVACIPTSGISNLRSPFVWPLSNG